MKLPSYFVAIFLAVAAVVSAPQMSRAEEATFDVFYTSLADEGDWYNTPDYGYVWQPYVAYQNDQWRPYTDGYWAQTDAGWTWVSYENFGWATYHYGRWTQLEGTGWVWVPGYEWGPGWVSWRQNDSYVGWAPIPPKHNRVAVQRLDVGVESEPAPAPRPRVERREVTTYDDLEPDYEVGYNASVDVDYDIGPSHYCFVPVASFGAPYVREVILAPQENFIIIGNTYNCTNICYRRGLRDVRFVYGGGPDFGFISRHVQRPIPRLFLDRRTDIGVSSFAQRGFSPLSVVRGDRLQVVGPLIARREIRFNEVHPPRVRENIVQVRPVNGWRGIQQQDPAAVQRLRAQYRQEAQVAPPARETVNRLAAPAEFRPNAPVPAPLPPPPQARVVREQQQQQPGGGRNINPPGGTAPGAAGFAPRPGQVGPAPGLQPANPAGRGAQDAADREARRNAQLQQMNERRAARGQPPLQPGGGAQPQTPATGAAGANATGAPPTAPQTREQARAVRQQQQREAQQAAQQQRQQAAEQQRQQQAAAAEQRRQQQQAAAQERAARQAERRGQPQPQQGPAAGAPQTGAALGSGDAAAARQENATARRAEAAEAARAQQEKAAQERSARQAEAQQQQQQRAEQGRAAAQARQQQQQQQQQAAAAGAERQRAAAEARQQQQQAAAAERQRANAEARQQQQQQAAQQQRAAAQAEARQQQAAQMQQQRAAAQQQAQQQQAAQRTQRQQPQPQQEGQPAEGGKRKRPEGQ